ncbi:MAG: type II toxin-antitoxin system VapB family antitoxin [Gammaproteobacteria bacterium]|nr:type II toxin-antitoxin system VapB family antitoxin [Gammaproteobacteria bacterium]
MARTQRVKVLNCSKGQTIRLPQAVALPDDVKQVDILVLGRSRLIAPAGEVWDSWFEDDGASDDFMADREQSAGQTRELL